MEIELQVEESIRQRADYTFKYNSKLGRHGWLRLTPAYSVKLVQEIINNNCKKGDHILDPFAGTATTGLVSSELGFNCVVCDINPFLIWIGNEKCKSYTSVELATLTSEVQGIIQNLSVKEGLWLPNMFNIERWWSKETLILLSSLREEIVNLAGEPSIENKRNLIWIAFCRLVIETSTAAFNHVSMSFKEKHNLYSVDNFKFLFLDIFNSIVKSAKSNIIGSTKIIHKDSKNLSNLENFKFDCVITSPPYPNRISYIRELRPYMYWTKFLSTANEAGSLDIKAIGGTWGVATSILKQWQPINNTLPQVLLDTCDRINLSGDKNSDLMSLYVHKFFDDFYEHLKNLRSILNENAKINYIIGNSSFYGIFVESDTIMMEILRDLRFTDIKSTIIRKRNSKKGLFEFNITAKWNK